MRIKEQLKEIADLTKEIDVEQVEKLAELIRSVKHTGRLFILGVGGSAANASHAVNDFRKICGIEAYAPTDNVAELTAWTNDVGWASCFDRWLEISKLNEKDVILIFSVGGGSMTTSINLYNAILYAKKVGAKIGGIVGPTGGKTEKEADVCVKIPASKEMKTPYSEAFQAIIWHLIAINL